MLDYVDSQDNRSFHAADRDPSVPADVPIVEVNGLDNYKLPKVNSITSLIQPATASINGGSGYGGIFYGKRP